MSDDNTTLGKASLWTSIVGIVLPVSFAVLAAIFIESRDNQQTANALCGVLLVVLELIALGCGIAARRTATGKAGLVISGILLLLVSFVVCWNFYPSTNKEIAGQPVPQPIQHPEAEVQRAAGQGERGEPVK